MKTLRIFTLLVVVIMTACVIPRVVTSNIAFFAESYSPKGSISVVSGDADVHYSLEFAAYKKKFETQLAMVGYTIESDPNKADYIALVAYGIGDGKTSTITSTSISDEIASSSLETTYNRYIALDILEASSFKAGKTVKVYEGRTKSEGSCSVIVEVFDEMLEAMFSDFPGENGRNRKQTVSSTFNC